MEPYATISFNIPDLATATLLRQILCPGAGVDMNALKAAIILRTQALRSAAQLQAAQAAALATVVQPPPVVLS